MPITNNLKKQIDQPVWEWSRFALTTFNSASAGFATAIDGSDRYIYYQSPGVFQRYDTWSDTWASLAAPAYYGTTTIASMVYSKSQGNRGRVLAAPTSSTLTIPSLISGAKLVGQTIRITTGVGAEQTRTITASTDPETIESGVSTGASTTALQDTTKKWQINQWVGYTVRISFGANAAFQRTVVFNDTQNLYFADINLQQHEPWDNQGFLVSFSGAFATYEISSQTITVNTPFVTTPTTNSRFMIMSGVIWLMSSAAATPFFYMADV